MIALAIELSYIAHLGAQKHATNIMKYLTWPGYSADVEAMSVIDFKIILYDFSLLFAFAADR